MKSVVSHDFATTPDTNIPRSRFDMSCGHKTTGDAGWLIPMFWMPVIPGDTISINMSALARLSTPEFPFMDNMFMDVHWFSASNRILWENFRKFVGEQVDPGDSIDYTIPVLEGAVTSDGTKMSSPASNTERTQALLNYLGVPYGVAPDDVEMSALPWRCYSQIYREWFRDQNLIDTPDCSLVVDDGPDDLDAAGEQHMLQRRGKRMDYFNQALPWPQKDLDTVTLPIGSEAPVLGIGIVNPNSTLHTSTSVNEATRTPTYAQAHSFNDTGTDLMYIEDTTATSAHPNGRPYVRADLTNATAATINELRQAFQIQRLLERDARSGTRFPEVIRNHFQTNFSDLAYRPEYLGGGSMRLNTTPVPVTANVSLADPTSVGTPGDLGAFTTASGNGMGFTKSFNEWSIVMCIISIRADYTYSQGINRHLLHQTRYDYFWPTLAGLGEQIIYNKELFVTGTPATDDAAFGYVPRYDEYRWNKSMITGLFQPDAPSPLSAWHLSQDFTSTPTLGQTFIEENPPVDRIIRVDTEPHFIIDTYFDVKAARPIPVNGVPGLIDHF